MSVLPADPWPAWEDHFINSVKWQDVKPATARPHGEVMPPEIPVAYWERPQYDDKSIEWSIAPEEPPLDLITNSTHLVNNSILVSIISSIHSLDELGQYKPFEPDHQGFTYVYNGGPNWKPWNHIYSMTKAGKGSQHQLKCNKAGLYFVRLFYMGEWRRIHVTDQLPYNDKRELLLPCSTNRYNLWPHLLTKALLEVATLSSGEDFDVISCLTGWTRYRIDARNLNIDAAWNIIQMYLVEGVENKASREHCLSNSAQECLNGDPPFFCYDSENELDNISPAEEHTLCIIEANVNIENDVETLPNWKKFRWVDWARDQGGLRESLGIVKRKVKIYSPFVKIEKPNPYSEENIQNLVGNVMEGKIITGNLKELLMEEVRKDDSMSSEDKLLIFDFSSIYPWIREFRVYYKSVQFKFVQFTTDLDSMFNVAPPSRKTSIKNATDQKLSSLKDNYRMKTFYIYSDSKFCKDFFITLSVYDAGEERCRPFVTCEEYNWKSTTQGKILFDQSTFGTITHLLQLGPGVQVCRFWYSLPSHHYFQICGNTHFEFLNEEGLQLKLSTFSETFLSFGDCMAKAFEQIRSSTLNSTDHFRLLYQYKKCFYPPVFQSMTENIKIKLVEDFHQVFDESVAELIFEEFPSTLLLAAAIEIYKLIFNNEQAFESIIKTLPTEDRIELQLAQESVCMSQKYYTDMVTRDLNAFKKERNIESDLLPRLSTSTERPLSLVGSATKKSIIDVLKLENTSILSAPHNNIKLLRKILNKKNEYLNLYPFRNEHELKLEFHDYVGTTEINVLQKWFLLTRLICNVHSIEAVPCNIQVKTNLPIKVTLLLFDIDSSQFVASSFALNRTYYVSRNECGYAVLLYACPNEDMIKTPLTTKWRIRITGVDKGNILHLCYKYPLLCKVFPSEPLEIISQSISGFYFPNSENIIGRFEIRSKSSPAVSLYISLVRPDLWMRVVIRAGDTELCAVEGKGSAIVPLLILHQNIPSSSTSHLEFPVYKGEIQLIDHWDLSQEEKLFVRYLRSLPEKEILSIEDFENLPTNVLGNFEEEGSEVWDEREREEDVKYSGKFGDILFSPEGSESSDDHDFYTEREYKTEPFGLLSHAPYWRVYMAIDELNKEDTVLLHDDQRWKEFEMFKISWEENDPGRAQKAEELRNDFLKFGSPEFLKKQLDADDLNISDYSECGIEEGQQNLDRFSFLSSKKKLTQRRKKKASNKKLALSDINVDRVNSGIRKDGVKILKRISNKNKQRKVELDEIEMTQEIQNEDFISPKQNQSKHKKKVLRSLLNLTDTQDNKELNIRLRKDGIKILKRKSIVEKLPEKISIPENEMGEEVVDEASSNSSFEQGEEKNVRIVLKKLTKSVENLDRVQKDLFSPAIIPKSSLLADLPPQDMLSPLIELYTKFNQDFIQDKLFDNNTLTGIILKMFSVTTKCLDVTNMDPDEFQFELSQEYEHLTIKEIKELAKHDYNWEYIVTEIIEPEFFPITKRKLPPFLDIPPMFLKENYMSVMKNAMDNYLNLKNEADDHISKIKENMDVILANNEEDSFCSIKTKNIQKKKKKRK